MYVMHVCVYMHVYSGNNDNSKCVVLTLKFISNTQSIIPSKAQVQLVAVL